MLYHRDPPKDLKRTLTNSPANEPLFNKDYLTEEELYYPNMKTVYDNFSSYFNIPQSNFILTSGTEESLRIAINAIKELSIAKSINLYYETPSWGMPNPIMHSIDYRYTYSIDYTIKDYKFILEDHDRYNNNENIIYTTDKFSNILYHDTSFNKYSNMYIVDDIYTLDSLYIPNYVLIDNIYIGSFSKAVSPGYRLGYIVYNSLYNDCMQTYRPLYVNLLATKMINSLATNKESKYRKILEQFRRSVYICISKNEEFRKLGHLDTIHPNYLTFEKDGFLYNKYKDRLEPKKEFTMSGKKFLRTGQRDLIDRIIYFGN